MASGDSFHSRMGQNGLAQRARLYTISVVAGESRKSFRCDTFAYRKRCPEWTYSDLLDIKAICDAGSYRKAAETLGVTQPTLSNRIAYLEGKLGARLFDREHGRSRPTELATLIANRAGIIGREAALLSKDIERLAAGQAGVVRIGMGPAPGRALLESIVERVATQLPQVAMEIVFGSTRALADQLQSRDLDIVICHPIESLTANLTCDLQLETENVIVAHPGHAIFREQADRHR